MTCGKVIAVEVDEVKVRLARWNAKVYGVEDRITFVREIVSSCWRGWRRGES